MVQGKIGKSYKKQNFTENQVQIPEWLLIRRDKHDW